MPAQNFGHLEHVDVRDIWPHEARDFTPWLLDNADRLAAALQIDLELRAAEHPVGDFSLDLIGRDLTNQCELIVENQLGVTDHIHLGQLMTYAAGTKAQTIVWIAPSFREEHREALRWLNEIAGDQARFFGVEVRVVRIGESLPAPLFELRAEPNEWSSTVRREARPASEREAQYRSYWERFLPVFAERHPNWPFGRQNGKNAWYILSSPYRHCRLTVSFVSNGRLMSELYIDSGDREKNLAIFERLRAASDAIEDAFGDALDWQELMNRRACRIAYFGEGSVTDVDRYPEFIDWMINAHARMRQALEAARVDVSDLV